MDKSIWRQCKRKNRYRDEHTANFYRRKFEQEGLFYGYEEIPKEWLAVIKKREWIEGMCEGLE